MKTDINLFAETITMMLEKELEKPETLPGNLSQTIKAILIRDCLQKAINPTVRFVLKRIKQEWIILQEPKDKPA